MDVHVVTHTHTRTHTGKDDSIGLGKTAGVVLRLVEPVSGLGHHVYTDNLYTSPGLFTELRLRGFQACGTLHLDRWGTPMETKERFPREREEL